MAGHLYDGIEELDNPLPRWWLWTFAITIVFAIFYWMAMHSLPSGTGSYEAYGEDQVAYDNAALAGSIDPATVKALASDPAAVERGKATFGLRCAACHGPEGAGSVGPNLTDKFWLHGGDLKSIYITVATGYPKLGMPEWRAVLEDKDIADVVAFLVTIRDTQKAGKAPQGAEYTGELVLPTSKATQ